MEIKDKKFEELITVFDEVMANIRKILVHQHKMIEESESCICNNPNCPVHGIAAQLNRSQME